MGRFEGSLIHCPLCGTGPDKQDVVSEKDRKGRPLRSVICTSCGLVFSNPMPDARQLDRYYTADYRLNYQAAAAPKPRHIINAFRLARRRLEGLKAYLPAKARVLDLGSGGGEWVHALSRAGYAAEGVEPTVGFAEYAVAEYGHPVSATPFDDAPLPDGAFDIVTSFHVLEHLRDPGAAMDRVHQLLKPKGKLIVEVPDIAARDQSMVSKFHEAHVIGFTSETMSALARRHGFSVDADLTGRLNGENVALVLARAPSPVKSAMPPAKAVTRVKAALAKRTRVHRKTVQKSLGKAWRQVADRIATRGLRGRQIADKVLGRR